MMITEFVEMIRKAGSMMTYDQIAEVAETAKDLFGIDKDILMLVFLSGTKNFKEMTFEISNKM